MQRFTYIFIVSFNHFSWYDPSPLPLTTRCEAAGILGYQPPPACDSHLPYQVGRRYKRRWPLPRNSPSRADRGGGAGRHTFHVWTRLQHQKQAVCFLNFIFSKYGRIWHKELTLIQSLENLTGTYHSNNLTSPWCNLVFMIHMEKLFEERNGSPYIDSHWSLNTTAFVL